MYAKLISSNPLIPNQRVDKDQNLVIGRNSKCKIKDLKCSRNYCEVFWKNNKLQIKYLNNNDDNNKITHLKSGDYIKGPGFSYRVSLMDRDSDKIKNNVNENIIWSEHDSGKVWIGEFMGGGKPSTKIAAFDFDFTLICTNTGKAFPITEFDYKLFDPKIPSCIKKLIEQDYRFVIFSNQMGVSKGKADPELIKKRFNHSLKQINCPCLIFIATDDDQYRKPSIGLWKLLLEKFQPNVDLEKSFYVGDAAGRPKTAKTKADFSASDLMFAKNCGLNFLLPEQFIEHMKNNETFNYPFEKSSKVPIPQKCFKFNAKQEDFLLKNMETGEKISDIESILPSNPHCIIFCGISGSGKTTFYQNYFKNLDYIHISMDLLKNKQKCFQLAEESFQEKKNCIIDNTNVDKTTRSEWIELCKKYNYETIIFYFELALNHIFHNNKYRKLSMTNQSVSDIVINTQNKKFQQPTLKECSKCFIVNFVPKFENSELENLYSMYLIEKS